MKLHGTMNIDEQDVLHIGGVSVRELVNKYGSPLMVLDENEIRKNINAYLDALQENYSDFKVLYAGKAFMNRTLCRILADEDMGLDVVSGGELYTAIESDFPAADICFHGNNKSPSEIDMALDCNIGRFMVDNSQEAELLNDKARQKGKKVKVILRIIPGIEAHTHEFIQTGQLDSKFGVTLVNNQALHLIKQIKEYDFLELRGIHSHIGSQIFVIDSFSRLIEVLFDFLQKVREETGQVLHELDLGGGLGIQYLNEEEPPSIKNFVKRICNEVKRMATLKSYPLPRILLEPGRSIIGTAGTTIYTIGTIKQVPNMTKYLAVDGGMNDNIRPALYDAEYEAFLANRCQEKPEEVVTIAGKCCESGDILIKDIKLPVAKSGDLLAVTCTGAYNYAMSSNYNSIPKMPVVLVKDGQANLIIKRESYQDLIKNDIIPEGY